MPLPACLRAAMMDKFAQFDEYQLAKYNPRKHRAKSRPCRPPRPPVSPCLSPGHSQPGFLFSGKGETKGHVDSERSHIQHLTCSYHQKNVEELGRAWGGEGMVCLLPIWLRFWQKWGCGAIGVDLFRDNCLFLFETTSLISTEDKASLF